MNDHDDLSLFIKKGLLLISYRQRSRFELEKKLKEYGAKRELDASYIPKAIDRLIEMGYQDDESFASWVVSSYAGKKGKRYIQYKLEEHNISSIVQEKVLSLLSEDELDSARRSIEKKLSSWRNLPYPHKANRIQSFLFRRGFSSSTIHQIIAEQAKSSQS